MPVIPAATVVLMRDDPPRPPLLLMVERSPALAFAPGALVFPGGRIEPGDQALAEMAASAPSDAAARIAAVREAIEEVGIAPGLDLSPPALASVRAGGAMPVPRWDALVPFARWRPREGVTRIFDTRFFLAQAADVVASVDGTENVRAAWFTAAAALAAADRGEVSLLFPTRCVLERLAGFAAFDVAVADAQARPETVVTPWIEHQDGAPWLRIPDGLGYPVTARPLASVRRG